MNKLFDKIVNIYLYDSVDGEPTDIITIPEVGIKPNIGIQAHFAQANVVFNLQVRIVNFYPSKALNQYKKIRIEGGYNKSQDLASFEGVVNIAYQESPSPDGVTLFSCQVADLANVYNANVNIHLPKGTSLDDAFKAVIDAVYERSGVQWDIENSLDPRTLESQLDFNGSAKDFVAMLAYSYNFNYTYDWNTLVVFEVNRGRDTIDAINIDYLSSPPAQSASGITFTAPWIPSLRPWMIVNIDPVYFKQSFGARNVDFNKSLMCQTVDINFNTVTNQNQMTVLALNTVEIPNE